MIINNKNLVMPGKPSASKKKIGKYVYSFEEKLGEGAFGKVYKGCDEQSGRVVAIKVIDMNSLVDEYFYGLIKREINVMKQLDHPNIVKLYDVVKSEYNIYIITEFCNGGDLGAVLKKRKYLSEKESVPIFRDILIGMQEMLKNDIIHRDLKPDNIFIHDGVCKIGDFGFAKMVKDLESNMNVSIVGTPLYMSPQILQNKNYSSKNDIWSLGIIFYEIVFGSTPWPNVRNQLELLRNIANQHISFPAFNPISESCKDLLSRMIRSDENLRITWKELLNHKLFNKYKKNKKNGDSEQRERSRTEDNPKIMFNQGVSPRDPMTNFNHRPNNDFLPTQHLISELVFLNSFTKILKDSTLIETLIDITPLMMKKLHFLLVKATLIRAFSMSEMCEKGQNKLEIRGWNQLLSSEEFRGFSRKVRTIKDDALEQFNQSWKVLHQNSSTLAILKNSGSFTLYFTQSFNDDEGLYEVISNFLKRTFITINQKRQMPLLLRNNNNFFIDIIREVNHNLLKSIDMSDERQKLHRTEQIQIKYLAQLVDAYFLTRLAMKHAHDHEMFSEMVADQNLMTRPEPEYDHKLAQLLKKAIYAANI